MAGIPGGLRILLCVLCLNTLLLVQCDQTSTERHVDIPDESFLGWLVEAGVDRDGNGLISIAEAEATRSIDLPPLGISDLTGLEAFVNLDSLALILNPLGSIDLSANRSLRYLSCTSCELTGLDLSGNLLLEYLDCGRNMLEELDVTKNAVLKTLVCNNNRLTELDLRANPDLVRMISCGNQLTSLDISKNTSLKVVGIDNMPMLREVCVWTLPFPPEGVITLQEYSPGVEFTDQCGN